MQRFCEEVANGHVAEMETLLPHIEDLAATSCISSQYVYSSSGVRLHSDILNHGIAHAFDLCLCRNTNIRDISTFAFGPLAPIFWAVLFGQVAAATFLLRHGANPNTTHTVEDDGNGCLFYRVLTYTRPDHRMAIRP